MPRNALITNLSNFYSKHGITPDENFACKNIINCKGNLYRGMQCHVGHNFGKKTRVLVVSLDCGKKGINSITERTQIIENLKHPINPHMKGTINIVGDFFQMENKKDCLTYFAMTNSCKCCGESSNQMDSIYYQNCSELKLKEIEVINPEVIYFQGKNALIGCDFTEIEDLKDLSLAQYIKHLNINGNKYLAVKCIHPSARGRSANKKNNFYEKILPKINSVLREMIHQM